MITNIYNWVMEPLSHPFMQHAMIAALVIGVTCAVLSCFLVLRGWSLMGDAVSHAVLPGIAIAEIVGFAYTIGAFFSGLLCALLTGLIGEKTRLKEDTIMGVVFSSMFAIGLLMVEKIQTDVHLKHVIQGNLLGITHDEFFQLIGISVFVLFVMLLKWKDFLLYSFDSSFVCVVGMSQHLLHYGLLVLLALTIVAAIQAVGVILVVALLIAPGITGLVLCKRFSIMLIVAIVSAVIAATFGVVISYHIGGSTAACIVLMQAVIFLLSLGVKQLQSLKQKSLKQKSLL